MPKKRPREVYQRLFFDRTLLVGIIFVALAYITRDTWVGAFTETAALMIGVVWSVRAATTNPSRIFRLSATLILVLIWLLISMYVARAAGII